MGMATPEFCDGITQPAKIYIQIYDQFFLRLR